MAGYASLMEGNEATLAGLDSLFSYGYVNPETAEDGNITGRIGQYAHGNEPSHAAAWLPAFVGDPSATQRNVRRILDEMYTPERDGICGNEDCGQMSAWYVLAALGIYPVCPGTGEFVFAAPVFKKATVTLGNGNVLTITADHPEYSYIKDVSFNGRTVEAQYITYEQLMQGGELAFTLSAMPCHDRDGMKAPYSLTSDNPASTPYLIGNPRFFDKVFMVDLRCRTQEAQIRYTLDGSEPTETSALYEGPFEVYRDCVISARVFKDGRGPSPLMTAHAFPAEYLQPVKAPSQLSPGCLYTYHQGEFSEVADVAASPVVSRGAMPEPSIEDAPDEDHFGYIFTGYLDIKEEGLWEFALTSDDGSVLEIDGRLAVNNDGSHSIYTAKGGVALLKGLHSFRLLYLEDYEGQYLDWKWKSPSTGAFEDIPVSAIMH